MQTLKYYDIRNQEFKMLGEKIQKARQIQRIFLKGNNIRHHYEYVSFKQDVFDHEFDNNRVWIATYMHSENEKQQDFAFIDDEEFGIFCFMVSFRNNVVKYLKDDHFQSLYRTAKGELYEKEEDKYLAIVKKALEWEKPKWNVDITKNTTSHKELTMKFSTDRYIYEAQEFFNKIETTFDKTSLRSYVDITIHTGKTNRHKKEILYYMEFERKLHKRIHFLIKLYKLSTTQRKIYFLLHDRYYDYHIDLIREYNDIVFNLGQKHRILETNIYACKLSEFGQAGFNAFKPIY
jgi:hypothetical protein